MEKCKALTGSAAKGLIKYFTALHILFLYILFCLLLSVVFYTVLRELRLLYNAFQG